MAWKKNGSPGRRSGTADPDTGRHGRHIAGGDAGRTLLREAFAISTPLVAIRSAASNQLSCHAMKQKMLLKKKVTAAASVTPGNTEFTVGAGNAFVRKACLIHLLD